LAGNGARRAGAGRAGWASRPGRRHRLT
jgi:hypothetical protein